ncbi:hypothetical protein [Psychroflexus sediminis]|uniref:Uncharacterized protein n=1 Tax=Psychroflexus sediminis TaxID=470826 RepID=A0A1G7Z6A3_9FLAO|nr:hypothetical protein [Psychroflexus sediminis]SDH04282.1 hypothetical protein SAMN04488027_11913 [Psychroflexus sediminis]
MTRVKLYRFSKVLSKFFIGLGIVILLLGMMTTVKSTNDEFNTEFPSGDWNAVLNIIQGIVFITFGTLNLTKGKYFIEWDETHLRFLRPGSKHPESIELSDIQSVDIRLFEIILHLPDRTQKFDLNALDDDHLKTIKAKFKRFKKNRELAS